MHGGKWAGMVYLVLLVTTALAIFYLPRSYGYLGATMGVASQSCDDAKTNLIVDWDYSFTAYSCMGTVKWKPNPDTPPLYYSIPNFNARKDQVWHYCMNTSILYKDRPPIRGHHRPLWAKYGEYLYLPPQRWLHNLEHGSIVMLYHPCADEDQINKLRQLLTSCMWRHVITPYDKLSNDRPLALVAWGAKLEMSTVDVIQSILFIRKHAHVAPEDIDRDGQYDEMLLKAASTVSDKDDSVVCPWVPTTNTQNTQLNANMLFGTATPATNPAPARGPAQLQQQQQQTQPQQQQQPAMAGLSQQQSQQLQQQLQQVAANLGQLQTQQSQQQPTVGLGTWASPSSINNNGRRLRRSLSRPRRTFVDVVNVAEKFNGPKFVPDVLPPSAILQMYEQPAYVVAGSFLGNSPLHPNTIQSSQAGPAPPPSAPLGNSPVPLMPPPQQQQQQQGLQQQQRGFPQQGGGGGGANPAEVLAAMAMLMRKDNNNNPDFQYQQQGGVSTFPPQGNNFGQGFGQQQQPQGQGFNGQGFGQQNTGAQFQGNFPAGQNNFQQQPQGNFQSQQPNFQPSQGNFQQPQQNSFTPQQQSSPQQGFQNQMGGQFPQPPQQNFFPDSSGVGNNFNNQDNNMMQMENGRQQFPLQLPPPQPQPANFFFSAQDPRQQQGQGQVQGQGAQQQQQQGLQQGRPLWARRRDEEEALRSLLSLVVANNG